MNSRKDTVRRIADAITGLYDRREAEAIARMVVCDREGISQSHLLVFGDEPSTMTDTDEITEELTQGRPVQYVLGHCEFCGLDFEVGEGVLIPRPETEELVGAVIERAHDGAKILDLCTGSGCIAIALSKGIARASVTAVDISEKALACAERNAAKNGADVRFVRCDILDDSARDAIGGSGFDIIVSNPPYIPLGDKASMHANVTMHEPHEALFVPDDDPLLFYVRIARLGRELLRDGGSLCFEIYEHCSERAAEMLASEGYSEIVLMNDANLKPRMICCRK